MVTGTHPGTPGSPALAPPLEYWIDAHDRVTAVNDAYLAELQAHGDAPASEPSSDLRASLLGKVLWDLLPHATEWYRPLVRVARAEQRVIAFAFRCDTPGMRRLMEMRISAREDGAVRFLSTLIGEQPRDAVALLASGVPRGTTLVSMCSWCKRVRAGSDWLEVERALDRLDMQGASVMPAISHGICGTCKHGLTAMARSSSATLSIDLPDADEDADGEGRRFA